MLPGVLWTLVRSDEPLGASAGIGSGFGCGVVFGQVVLPCCTEFQGDSTRFGLIRASICLSANVVPEPSWRTTRWTACAAHPASTHGNTWPHVLAEAAPAHTSSNFAFDIVGRFSNSAP